MVIFATCVISPEAFTTHDAITMSLMRFNSYKVRSFSNPKWQTYAQIVSLAETRRLRKEQQRPEELFTLRHLCDGTTVGLVPAAPRSTHTVHTVQSDLPVTDCGAQPVSTLIYKEVKLFVVASKPARLVSKQQQQQQQQ